MAVQWSVLTSLLFVVISFLITFLRLLLRTLRLLLEESDGYCKRAVHTEYIKDLLMHDSIKNAWYFSTE